MKLLFWRRSRIPVVELHGIISTKPGTLNLRAVGPMIDRAVSLAKSGAKVLVLDIESPGGSPVQSDLIAARIRRRADEDNVRVVAVIGEVGASGGYWLACAGDEIVAHPMSIVGSIGVIGGGFGFVDAIHRIGVERRIYTAGENKARLDPFSPERPEDRAFTRELLDDLHGRFKGWVRTRRAGKLTPDEGAIFDGGYMLGDKAQTLGLIDRAGDLDSVLRDIGGKKAARQVFRPKRRGMLGRLPRLLAREAVEGAMEVMRERAAQPDIRV